MGSPEQTSLQNHQSLSRRLRGLPRRLFPLKRVARFKIYACHWDSGYHEPVEMDNKTVTVLQSFYHDYNSAKEDYEDRWMKWMHFSLNNTSHDPGDGKYALQLVLRCSPVKITVYVTAPIVLSLVIGIWYMRHTGGIQIVDHLVLCHDCSRWLVFLPGVQSSRDKADSH
jgi:hypothetical protein